MALFSSSLGSMRLGIGTSGPKDFDKRLKHIAYGLDAKIDFEETELRVLSPAFAGHKFDGLAVTPELFVKVGTYIALAWGPTHAYLQPVVYVTQWMDNQDDVYTRLYNALIEHGLEIEGVYAAQWYTVQLGESEQRAYEFLIKVRRRMINAWTPGDLVPVFEQGITGIGHITYDDLEAAIQMEVGEFGQVTRLTR